MRRMRREPIDDVFERMQKMFEDFQEAGKDITGFGTFPIDVKDEGDSVSVTADLPGMRKEDINLKADEEKLEIAAESSEEVKEENEKYFRRERSERSFRREIAWPTRIDPETVHAEYDEGVLEVTAEKEEASGRDIEIE